MLPGDYGPLADGYDAFTQNVPYEKWADFLEKLFARHRQPIATVLDLACGTGTMTHLLAARGYETIGVDGSCEMLAQAAEKPAAEGEIPPLFLCQPMEALDLYGTVDACVCLLDSINHLTSPRTLAEVFRRLHLFIAPGGLLVFDVHGPGRLAALDGQLFTAEDETHYCIWQTEYDARRRLCSYGMDLFSRTGEGLWRREEMLVEEYDYAPAQLEQLLTQAGFTKIRQYGDAKLRAPRAGESRIFFTAERKGE